MKWRLPRFLVWNNNPFPLPQDTAQIVLRLDGAIANLRALMNRFLGYEQNRNRFDSRDSDAVEQGAEWLAQALQTLGVGAKTSAGYGFWVIDGGA